MTLTGDDYDQSDPVTIVNGDGERVEGHWVLAMADVFWDHVAGSFQPSSQEISSSYNGDLLLKESWLNNPAVGQRFMDYIWWPLVNLVQAGDRSVRELIEQMRLLNPADWPALRTTLQKQKMAFPVIDRLQPLTGDKAGGEHVSIYGAHFTDGAPAVSFNNVPAMGVHVLSGNELLILTPAGAVGHCNVVVSNAAGASAPAAFHYL
jgi:hypothetical protein